MTTAKSEVGAPQEKRAWVAKATVTYPYHPLELCIELAKAVREIGNGRAEVTKSQLAHRLGVSEQSSDFAAKVASTKTYGLIDGRITLQLTDVARQYFFPTEEGDHVRKRCLFKFFSFPGLFTELIDLYDGSRLPAVQIISNLIGEKYGIPESWKGRIASYFLKSSTFIGAMQPDGFLRFKAQLDGLGIDASDDHQIKGQSESAGAGGLGKGTGNPEKERKPPEGVIVWTYPCGDKMLRIETPENMTKEIWEKLNKYIQVLQP